jgi:hypothetical protein
MRKANREYVANLKATGGYAISQDTCRIDDIGCAVSIELEDMGLGDEPEYKELDDALVPCFPDDVRQLVLDLPAEEEDRLSQALAEAEELIDEALPEGFYYGTAEGDGACVGVWQVSEEDEEGPEEEE